MDDRRITLVVYSIDSYLFVTGISTNRTLRNLVSTLQSALSTRDEETRPCVSQRSYPQIRSTSPRRLFLFPTRGIPRESPRFLFICPPLMIVAHGCSRLETHSSECPRII